MAAEAFQMWLIFYHAGSLIFRPLYMIYFKKEKEKKYIYIKSLLNALSTGSTPE